MRLSSTESLKQGVDWVDRGFTIEKPELFEGIFNRENFLASFFLQKEVDQFLNAEGSKLIFWKRQALDWMSSTKCTVQNLCNLEIIKSIVDKRNTLKLPFSDSGA